MFFSNVNGILVDGPGDVQGSRSGSSSMLRERGMRTLRDRNTSRATSRAAFIVRRSFARLVDATAD